MNRLKTFGSNSSLLAADLNGEFDNIINEVNRMQTKMEFGTVTRILSGYFELQAFGSGYLQNGIPTKMQSFYNSDTRTWIVTARRTADNTSTTCHVDFSGQVRSAGVALTSVREAKKNIVPFEKNAVELIEGVQVREYNFKTDEDGAKTHIGFIVDEAPKEFVNDEQTGIEIYDVAAVLVKAVQELSAEVKALKAELAAK